MTAAVAATPVLHAQPSPRIRILVGDPHPLVRQGLITLLAGEPDFDVIGEADDRDSAFDQMHALTPGVALLAAALLSPGGVRDTRHWPLRNGHNGQTAASRAASAGAACRIVALVESLEVSEVERLLLGGVRGLIRKTDPVAIVAKCIRKVHEGQLWLARPVLADLVMLLSEARDPQSTSVAHTLGLTTRELQVLQLVASGDTNKGIARQLSVCEDTIKHHLTRVFDKTGSSNRTELVMFAYHHGLIRPD